MEYISTISTNSPISTKSPKTTTTESNDSLGNYLYLIFYSIFVLIWAIAGIVGFITSIACLFYESSPGEKVIGVFLGLLTGPFFWLYYIYNMNYCNRYY